MTYAVVVGEDVNCSDKSGACLPVRVLRGRVLRWLGGETCGDPSEFFRLFALLRFWTESALEVSGHLLGCTLIPTDIYSIRCRRILQGWLVPRVNEWRGLLMEVRLVQHGIAEAQVRPRERGEAKQEVVALCARFP